MKTKEEKQFEKRWEAFIEFESNGFDGIKESIYLKAEDLFIFPMHDRYLKIRVSNDEFKEKLKGISSIYPKK